MKISTGLSLDIPHGLLGQIMPRSGLATKHSIDIGGGVIDNDYRGDIQVIMINNQNKAFHINVGDKIAQLVFQVVRLPYQLNVL